MTQFATMILRVTDKLSAEKQLKQAKRDNKEIYSIREMNMRNRATYVLGGNPYDVDFMVEVKTSGGDESLKRVEAALKKIARDDKVEVFIPV